MNFFLLFLEHGKKLERRIGGNKLSRIVYESVLRGYKIARFVVCRTAVDITRVVEHGEATS